ncbi:MAG: hypothetical protein GF411_02835 [Candidatus Lokiarchaeota archaeon]|nr:hypothetical protein [Candidatus Lokiarchaeota archaeon]
MGCTIKDYEQVNNKIWWKPWTWFKRLVIIKQEICDSKENANANVYPEVFLKQVDVSESIKIDHYLSPICGISYQGPDNKPKFYGPSIEPIRWWQFWRWYLIPRYHRECKHAYDKFVEDFGQPRSDNIMAKAMMHSGRTDGF